MKASSQCHTCSSGIHCTGWMPSSRHLEFVSCALSMRQGETSKNLPKPTLSSNQWAFVTGSSIGTLPGGSQAALGLLETLIAAVAQQLQAKPGVCPSEIVIMLLKVLCEVL